MSEPTPDGPNVTYVLDPTAHLGGAGALHTRVVEALTFSGEHEPSNSAVHWDALLDIAVRHEPLGLHDGAHVCRGCGHGVPWPCVDFRACARAVGVEIPQ